MPAAEANCIGQACARTVSTGELTLARRDCSKGIVLDMRLLTDNQQCLVTECSLMS